MQRIAILGAGKIGESLWPGSSPRDGRHRRHGAPAGARRRAAGTLRRPGHALERGGRRRRTDRRGRGQAAGHGGAAGAGRPAPERRPHRRLGRGRDPDRGDRAPSRRRRPGRPLDAERGVVGHEGWPASPRARTPARSTWRCRGRARAPRQGRPRPRGAHGRGHRGVRLRPRVLRAARRGDDRGGLLLGLSREVSTQLVVQTMLGTAKLLRDEAMHPVELREAVTSPGGTTIPRSASSSRRGCARPSSTRSRPRWSARKSWARRGSERSSSTSSTTPRAPRPRERSRLARARGGHVVLSGG